MNATFTIKLPQFELIPDDGPLNKGVNSALGFDPRRMTFPWKIGILLCALYDFVWQFFSEEGLKGILEALFTV